MKSPRFALNCVRAVVAATLGVAASVSVAAPTVTRLTPPSERFATGVNDPSAPMIARFLPGQRFDLQATIRPDAGATITGFQFAVDGVTVPVTASTSGIVTTGLNAGLPANTAVVSKRAYSNTVPGVHTLTVKATQSDGQTVTATGSFEVVGITNQGRPAKNIIILLGDGMGAAHRTAARIMAKGYAQGKAKGHLAMDTFPYTGMVMTSSLDTIVTDSAPGMANYVNGNKQASGQEGVWPDDTADAFDNPRMEYLSEYLHRTQGKSLGIVTTADVFDATPAANAVHTSNRGNGTGIADQYLDDRKLTGLTVLMGGGRKWFLPNASNSVSPQPANGSQRRAANDYVLTSDIVSGWGAAVGAKDPERDLISDFSAAGYTYVSDKSALQSAGVPDKLLGLFAYSNMNVAFDKINGRRGVSSVVNDYGFPDQPMLEEMTDKAIKVLAKNPKGFVLTVEGASIDKQAHLMDSDRWIEEVIEFDRAVQVAKNFATANPDTLVIVTADHETGGASILGASKVTNAELQGKANTVASMRNEVVGTYQDAKFPKYTIAADGYPATTDIDNKMLIGYGANADRYEAWIANAQPTQDSQQPFVGTAPLNTYPANPSVRNASTGYLVTGQVSGDQAVHTATDIPLSAFGRGAALFTGVMDNTDVFFKFGQAAIGGVK
ncbi:alkaline phosphatase [Methylovorus glucosotrophus]|jgi:alkaline phosphatase|uniref:Alkaline phosphatase n=1 Tax=Methylovorus glucosotrophus (strain SIP3-4) TaxID=582744 RepID=C6XCJ4_METGS|nr:alkaline phosphatase [Methylovorus glucosotrophus]ACT50269.1 Alkaline phosphatase [Methylovorus glucosotrophus SIP3-4]KAF0844391.1 alkaline phosphatase [Methylovorus glucosotrophus]